MTKQFSSPCLFVEGDLDSVNDYTVAKMLNFAKGQYKAKKTELEQMPEVSGTLAPTEAEIKAEYDNFDLLFFSQTPSTIFAEAVELELSRLGYTYDKGVPGIEITWNKNPKDIGPSDFVANRATVTVKFSKEQLDEFRKYLIENDYNEILSGLE